MSDYFKVDSDNTQNIKGEVEAIKKDIESLAQRLVNIKDSGGIALQEQLDNLNEVILQMKDKAISSSRDSLAELYSSTRRHPIRNMAYAFGLGCVLSYLMKR